MPLDDKNIRKLLNLIRDSFRVRKNHDPLYVDLANNLERIEAAQHQVIFGRRGSGKSCLLIHYLNHARYREERVLPLYILADEYKKLTYPDILIQLLIHITEDLQKAQPLRNRWFEFRGHIDYLTTKQRESSLRICRSGMMYYRLGNSQASRLRPCLRSRLAPPSCNGSGIRT